MDTSRFVLPDWALDPDYFMEAYRADTDLHGSHTLTRTDKGLSCFVVKAGYCMLAALTPSPVEGTWNVEAWEQFGNWGAFGVWGPKDVDQLSLALNVSAVTEPPSLVTMFSIENIVPERFSSANVIEFYAALDAVLDLHIAHLYTGYLCGLIEGLSFQKVSFTNDPYQGFSVEGAWRGQNINFASDAYGFASMACTDESKRNLWMASLTLLRTSVICDMERIEYKEIRELLKDVPQPVDLFPRVLQGTELFETSEVYSPMEFAVMFGLLVENADVTSQGYLVMKTVPDLVPSVPAPFGTLMYGEPKQQEQELGMFRKALLKWRNRRG